MKFLILSLAFVSSSAFANLEFPTSDMDRTNPMQICQGSCQGLDDVEVLSQDGKKAECVPQGACPICYAQRGNLCFVGTNASQYYQLPVESSGTSK